jgi:hypothetical protein
MQAHTPGPDLKWSWNLRKGYRTLWFKIRSKGAVKSCRTDQSHPQVPPGPHAGSRCSTKALGFNHTALSVPFTLLGQLNFFSPANGEKCELPASHLLIRQHAIKLFFCETPAPYHELLMPPLRSSGRLCFSVTNTEITLLWLSGEAAPHVQAWEREREREIPISLQGQVPEDLTSLQ